MFGLINLYKPSGISSRQALNRVQRWVRPHKIGHTGTLDPLAEGVLVVTLGPATRLTSHIHAWPKSYRGTFLLGRYSDTLDVSGTVTECVEAPQPDSSQLPIVLRKFRGTLLQQPPAYSALKIDGQRAYQRARQGEPVELAARPVTIFDLQIERYEYPELRLNVICSGGTYIRSLGRDIARALGTEAVMTQLTRTAVGHLTIDSAVHPDQLSGETIGQHLLSAREAVRDLPWVEITEPEWQRLSRGQDVQLPDQTAGELAAVTPDGDLAALLCRIGSERYRPLRNLVAAPAM
jgi:tRNA pseudouridine55 synthase